MRRGEKFLRPKFYLPNLCPKFNSSQGRLKLPRYCRLICRDKFSKREREKGGGRGGKGGELGADAFG